MKYYALFIDTNGYIEKCIALIKYICNPYTKSFPHITIRVFKEKGLGTSMIEKVRISYLNLFEIGNFNFFEKKPPYVVYLRCESAPLEAQEYKPDYPYSQLHITLYKGDDYDFANKLYKVLSSIEWRIKLSFKEEKKLVEKTIGEKVTNNTFYSFINDASKEILDEDFDFSSLNFEQKITLIKRIVKKIKLYKNNSNSVIKVPISFYENSYNNLLTGINKNNSIFITPPEYALEMVESTLPFLDHKHIAFGDSSIGTGSLYLALLNLVNVDRINSAIGIDIDENMVIEAKRKFTSRKLEVFHKDALFIEDGLLNRKRNLMLVNPPYNRSSDIPSGYRNTIQEIAFNRTGITVSKNASLYVYHLLIMDKWLCSNGIATWLLPSSFLQTKYGLAIRDYLTTKVTLLKIHSYDDEKEQFSNANVSTTIVVFKKARPNMKNNYVEVSFGTSAIHANKTKKPISIFFEEKNNWRKIIFYNKSTTIESNVKICDLFDIKRGLATGANSFFVLEKNKAEKLGIPKFALKPVLPKARFIEGNIIESDDDGYPKIDKQMVLVDCNLPESQIKEEYPKFYEYLETAKQPDNNGKTIVSRTLVKSRNPWYKQEQRTPPKFLLTYMGRQKVEYPSLYFILNKSKAIALNTYLLLYPKPWLLKLLEDNQDLDKELLVFLNNSAHKNLGEGVRVYAGALQKIEPNELRLWNVYGLPRIIYNYLNDHMSE